MSEQRSNTSIGSLADYSGGSHGDSFANRWTPTVRHDHYDIVLGNLSPVRLGKGLGRDLDSTWSIHLQTSDPSRLAVFMLAGMLPQEALVEAMRELSDIYQFWKARINTKVSVTTDGALAQVFPVRATRQVAPVPLSYDEG